LAIGLIALSPVLSLAIATFFGSLFGVYVVNIEIRPGAVPVLLIMTAAGTAAVVGGAWIITTGYRRRRIPILKPQDGIAEQKAHSD
jgi:alcohol dehydrogenase class IV